VKKECPILKSKGGEQEEVGSALAALAMFILNSSFSFCDSIEK